MTSFLKTTAQSLLLMMVAMSTTAQASEYIVKYREQMSMMSLDNQQVRFMDHHAPGQYYVVDIDDSQKLQGLLQLVTNPNVEYVVPNIRLHMFSAPVNAEALQSQWAINKIRASDAWQRAGNKGSRKVVVAVIDTGADYNHKNLAPNMISGWDFINNNDKPMDVTGQNPGHGTHCSGIIGATGLIDGGTTGISPEVSIMPLRFLDKDGSGDLNNAVKAIDYAVQKKVDVISASWGAAVDRSQAQPIIDAITRAEKAGIIFVVAASNDGQNNDNYEVYPANAGTANLVSVAASSSDDSKPSWSNYGRGKVSLASPGDAIQSTLPNDKYGELSGTSMATPLVAGLVAFIKAQDATLNPVELRSLLQASGDKVTSIPTACDCRINAYSAVDEVLSKKMFVSPYAGTYAVGDKVQFEAVYGKAPVTFTSSAPNVGSIDASGNFTAVAHGQTTISVKDSSGATATSYNIYVGAPAAPAPTPSPNPGGGGGGGGSCPLGDASTCQALCQVVPSLPFCSGGGSSPSPAPAPAPAPGNGGGSCPLGDASTCQALCQAVPSLPFCSKPIKAVPAEPTYPKDDSCPLGDASICQAICQQQPSMSFCNGSHGPQPTPSPSNPGTTCPLGDAATCQQVCQQVPSLPFCK